MCASTRLQVSSVRALVEQSIAVAVRKAAGGCGGGGELGMTAIAALTKHAAHAIEYMLRGCLGEGKYMYDA